MVLMNLSTLPTSDQSEGIYLEFWCCLPVIHAFLDLP